MEKKVKAECYGDSSLPPEERARILLRKMTLPEKVGQLNQKLYGFAVYQTAGTDVVLTEELKQEIQAYSGLGILYGLYRADPWSKRDWENGLWGELAVKAYNTVQAYVLEHSRLKIPMLLSTECPHGHQALEGYLLPVNLALAATWNPELVGSAYEICARQMKGMGVNLALISLLDVLRDPRWGRSEECLGEDPCLAGAFGARIVEAVQREGVAVVAKHFCAQGEGTGGVNASAARIGQRELREIHYEPARICCLAGVQGIMAAYNEIDGVYCHASRHLLTEVLREEMGFQGVVMADGTAIDRLDSMTGDGVISGARALRAGVDIGLWDEAFGRLEEACRRGLVTEEDIDRAVMRVLTLKFSQGLFEHPFLDSEKPLSHFTYEQYPQALELARESVILLKNEEDILPLSPSKNLRLAVIGPNADAVYHQLGDYTPPIREEDGVSVWRGIREYLEGQEVIPAYCEGCGVLTGTEAGLEQAGELAGSSDLVILVLGGSSSRFGEVQFDINGAVMTNTVVGVDIGAVMTDAVISMDCGEGVDCASLELPLSQCRLAERVFAQGKPVITVMIQGRPYAIPEIVRESRALLCCFYPGIKGGQAIAEVLFGAMNPSGRLPVSIPRQTGQIPVYYNHKKSYQAMHYYDCKDRPLFRFGEGFGYSRFSYENRTPAVMQQNKDNINIEIRFSVKNKSSVKGHAVPQLYIHHKQTGVVARIRELKAFRKILLEPDSREEVVFRLDESSLSVWDEEMRFRTEPGIVEWFLADSGSEFAQGEIRITTEE